MKETMTAGRTRLTAFFDAATFVELNAHMRRPSDADASEGVVCGYGALDGRLVFAFAQDDFGVDRFDQTVADVHDEQATQHADLRCRQTDAVRHIQRVTHIVE